MRKLVFGLILAFGLSIFPAAGAHADTVSDEASFVAKINDLRAGLGVPALQVDAGLVAKARGWAAGMAAAGKIWHSTLSDGITADWEKLGENVGMGGSVDGLHAAFVASPHHYENLVDPAFGYVGIGIAMNGDTIYVAEEFMEFMPPEGARWCPRHGAGDHAVPLRRRPRRRRRPEPVGAEARRPPSRSVAATTPVVPAAPPAAPAVTPPVAPAPTAPPAPGAAARPSRPGLRPTC